MEKTCKTCKQTKDVFLFGMSKAKSGNMIYNPYCKECRALKGRKERSSRVHRICIQCGTPWQRKGGSGRRNVELCDKCYPTYRSAYSLYHASKLRSQEKGIEFDLTVELIHGLILKGMCPRTGFKFEIENKGSDYSNRSPYTPSIDKINPSKGYTKDNIQVVCWWYNFAKQRYTDREVLELCKAVVNHNS